LAAVVLQRPCASLGGYNDCELRNNYDDRCLDADSNHIVLYLLVLYLLAGSNLVLDEAS
jgi:hypothetical protein